MDGTDRSSVYRSGSARPIAVATWATCAALGAGRLLAGPPDAVGTYAVVTAVVLVAVVAWVALWRPSVEVAPHGVVLHDPLRTVLVTWPALVDLDGRFGLRLSTATRRWSAWAAAPPAGRERRLGREGEVAAAVRSAWDDVRGRGLLESGAVERPDALVTRERAPLTAVGVTTTLLVVLVVLARLG